MSHCRTCAVTVIVYRLKATSGGLRRDTGNSAIGGARRAAARKIGRARRESSEAKVFRAHDPPQGACDHLVCALKPLADPQTGG